MFRNKILFVVSVFIIMLVFFIYLAVNEAKKLPRDTSVLLNKYYFLQHKNKEAAAVALKIILGQEKSNIIALRELSRLYLEKGKLEDALPLIKRLSRLEEKREQYQLQAARIYYQLGMWDKARQTLFPLKSSADLAIRQQALYLLQHMKSYIPHLRLHAEVKSLIPLPKIKLEHAFLDRYYELDKNENAADFLNMAFYFGTDNPLILQEKGYLALRRKRIGEALYFFLNAYQQNSTPELALQIAYLYLAEKDENAARDYFLIASRAPFAKTRDAALKSLDYLAGEALSFKKDQSIAMPQHIDPEAGLMNQFYELKKDNKPAAWRLILKIAKQYPTNTQALKEAGYLALDLNYRKTAIHFFTRAYRNTQEPELAMQLGYLQDLDNNQPLAYQYFELAAKSADQTLALKAQNALVNLAGLQTKAFPKPYFGEVFFTPFSQSRFGLTVRPLIARLGVELDDRWQTKTYLLFRQTDDNKSSSVGELPQIYEDNVRIIGTGVQISPIQRLPLVGWVEAGGAYDLVFRNRNPWRGDLRGGVMYYNEFGKKTAYYERLRIKPDYYSTLYGDITYFSRYDNNVIGTLKTHQGIHLVQYHNALVNLYLSGRIIEDTRREFFNNIAEVGPGLGIIPYNRFNLELRMEWIRGVYLPAGGSVNPYGKYYNNNIVQLLYYVKV
ncbi:tetratricopeptide repeat protein [Legionella londiniensis]|uniref:Anaphase-promoting complex, cyclosome, subunit 3 n=1 Tax=Legionella londiniensis TaxID=45068 RepID=A0A0W0VIC1_9GAMM|nr:hypothetical protein [Legionella londiniensis]KTD19876.1 hypothetical protein Llon_2048 [Legionella londiniensis]STX94252.1 Uncharacterized enzyme of heme biosynthesis [Legionella londiniensis]